MTLEKSESPASDKDSTTSGLKDMDDDGGRTLKEIDNIMKSAHRNEMEVPKLVRAASPMVNRKNTDDNKSVKSVKSVQSVERKMSYKSLALLSVSDVSSMGGSRIDVDRYQRPAFQIEFEEEPDLKYECPVCKLTYWQPVQLTYCEHSCCYSCYQDLALADAICPIDGVKFDVDNVLMNVELGEEVNNLKVKCSFFRKNCAWEGLYGELPYHLSQCNWTPVKCPKCEEVIVRSSFEKHIMEECRRRLILCALCNKKIYAEDEIDHFKVCDEAPIDCSNKCGIRGLVRCQYKSHIREDCPYQVIECPYVVSGCGFMCERNKMNEHLDSNSDNHLDKMYDTLRHHQSLLSETRQQIEDQAEHLAQVDTKVNAMEKLYGSQLVWKIENYSVKLEEAKSGIKSTIYSPPFLTSRHGYKLALSACLYGDGKVRGKSLSIFVCICKGDFDALLDWPFRHKIQFTMIDQNPDETKRRNISHVVQPNICKENMSFLGRPKLERNSSFGAQKFVELELLPTRYYTKDDCLFIKVDVDSKHMILL